jgi:hypothetical protein
VPPGRSSKPLLVGREEAEALLAAPALLVVLVVGGLGRLFGRVLRLEQIVGKLSHGASLAG